MPITNLEARLYGNLTMLSPEGIELCKCSIKKFRWYESRGLAKMIDEKRFQINFIPKGYGNAASSYKDYYLGEKKNVCVVCGTSEDLTKHHVVPQFYRKHFPVQIKARSSHDLVVICHKDHYDYETEAGKLSKQIAIEYGVSIHSGTLKKAPRRSSNWGQYDILRGLSIALSKPGIPEKAIEEIKLKITKINGSLPSDEELKIIANSIPISKSHSKIKEQTHGYLVVQKLIETNTLNEFSQRWRHHFLEISKPKFMPNGWNPDLVYENLT